MSANYRSQQQHAFGTCPTGPSLLRSSRSTVSILVARSRSSEKPQRTWGWLQASTARFSAWVESCADAYATAALYGELARLSDAELRRRGLARETLARDVSDIGALQRHPVDAAE